MDIGLPGAPGAPVLNAARAAASRRNGAPGPVEEKGPQPLPSPGAKSRGPKTPEGKAGSARNALKHGLRAEKFVLLHDEDAKQFEAMADALADDLAPLGALQSVLARRLICAAWRLERADRIESELFAIRAERSERGWGRLGLALVRDGNGSRAFDTLLRYRGSAMAELWRALRAFKALQAEAARDQVCEAEPDLPAPPQDEQPIEPEALGNPGEIASALTAHEAPGRPDAECGKGQAVAPAGQGPCTRPCVPAPKTTQECATMRHLCATYAPPLAGEV